ncbi:MAG: DUF937 domain-containing protein [Sphingomicrobium sp.]
MDLMNALAQAGGVDAISRELGVDQSTAQSGLGALLPAVVDGMRGQADSHPQGFGGLASILAGLGGGGLLSSVLGPEPTNVSQGNDVLGQIFGNKDTSRAVAADASQTSGISPDLLKKMLPIVAMLVAGYLAKQSHAAPAGAGADAAPAPAAPDGGILGQILGGAGGGGGILGSILGGLTRR